MPVPKGLRGNARVDHLSVRRFDRKSGSTFRSDALSIRDLARKLTREEQFVRGNDTAESDDDFDDEVYAPPRKGGRAMSLHEGAARMTANDLGVDPDLAAKAGPAAAKALGALSDANSAEDSAEKTRCIRRAQKHLRMIDPSRHGKLIQQIQARLLAAQGRGGDTEVAHVTPGELVLPPDLQTPELMALLQDAADARGIDVARLFVGNVRNSINPRTRTREFKAIDPNNPDPTIETFTVTAPAPNSFIDYGTFQIPTVSSPDPGFGIGNEPWLNAPTPDDSNIIPQPSQPDPDIEEIVVTAPRKEPGTLTPWDILRAIVADARSVSDDDLVLARKLGLGTAAMGGFVGGLSVGGADAIPRMNRHIEFRGKKGGAALTGTVGAISAAATW